MRTLKIGIITLSAVMLALPACAESWVLFNEPNSGLKMAHPKSWAVEKNPDAEGIVKFSGTTSDGKFGEIKLSLNKDEIESEHLAEYTRLTVLKSLPGAKNLSSTALKFGRLGQFSGNSVEVSFNMNGLPVHQQYVFFKHGGKTYTIAFTSPEAGFAQLVPTYKQALSYFDGGNSTKSLTPRKSGTTGGAGIEQIQLTQLEDNALPIKLYYPLGWSVTKDGKADERDLKFSGNGPTGKAAELHFWYGPRPEGTLDHLVEIVEDEYMKPLAQYQRVTNTHTNVSGVDGVKQYATFAIGGVPVRQNALFFADGKSFYCMTLTSATWTQPELRDLFDRVVSTLKLR
jgi:hypothetical protein